MFKSIKKFFCIFFGLKKKEICNAYHGFISQLLEENSYLHPKLKIYDWSDIHVIAVCLPLLILKMVGTFIAFLILMGTIMLLGLGFMYSFGFYFYYWGTVFSEWCQCSIIRVLMFIGLFVFSHWFICFIVSNAVKAYKILKEQQ